jgi:hypothetical protein
MITSNRAVFVCIPAGLHHAKVTDTYPADAIVIGATNQPTGHREGYRETGTGYTRPQRRDEIAGGECRRDGRRSSLLVAKYAA